MQIIVTNRFFYTYEIFLCIFKNETILIFSHFKLIKNEFYESTNKKYLA